MPDSLVLVKGDLTTPGRESFVELENTADAAWVKFRPYDKKIPGVPDNRYRQSFPRK